MEWLYGYFKKVYKFFEENIDFTWPEILWKKSGQSIEDLDTCMTDVIGLAAQCAGYDGKIEDVFALDQWLTESPMQAGKMFFYAEIFFSATKIDKLNDRWKIGVKIAVLDNI